MKRFNGRRLILLISLISCLSFGFSMNFHIWEKRTQGIFESEIKSLMIDPQNNSLIYVGTSKALYKSDNQGRDYRIIFQSSGDQKSVNFIYIDRHHPQIVYAATDTGLYESQNAGETWNKIYDSSNTESKSCLSLVQDQNGLYLGTQRGLFHRPTNNRAWQRMDGFERDSVYLSLKDDDFLYFITDRALFRLNKQNNEIKQLFTVGIGEITNGNGNPDQELALEERKLIKDAYLATYPINALFLATTSGIYFSTSQGDQWQRLFSDTVPLDQLTSLLVLKEESATQSECDDDILNCLNLLAGSKRGVFLFKKRRWAPLYKGMETNTVSYLAKDADGKVYAATDRGVFYLATEKALPSEFNASPRIDDYHKAYEHFVHEPSIKEVHELAIDYAEVSSGKIKNWRESAKKSAWLPTFSIGVDGDHNLGIDDSVSTTTSGGGSSFVGADDKSYDKNLSWDVSLSWNLSELIWNTDQTSIDSRSKLMVELREDVLDQVTRLYFERRRLQIECESTEGIEPQFKFDKQMRIAELTALIDAFTGGQFSERIEQQQKKDLLTAGKYGKKEVMR